MVVIWTELAKTELKSIYDQISLESKFYAQKTIETIFESTDKLEQFPEIGRIVPEIEDPNTREIFVFSYRIIYEIRENNVEIDTIIHGKRDFNTAFKTTEH